MIYNPFLALRGAQWILGHGMGFPGLDDVLEILPAIVAMFKRLGICC